MLENQYLVTQETKYNTTPVRIFVPKDRSEHQNICMQVYLSRAQGLTGNEAQAKHEILVSPKLNIQKIKSEVTIKSRRKNPET